MKAFLASLDREKVWAQLLIQRSERGFTLRHCEDRECPPEELKPIPIAGLRFLAMFNASRQFRPLRSSPDLACGWLATCSNADELWRAVQELYPGSIADWFAAQGNPPVTHYRDFTNRQSGMYRITQLLTDEQAGNVARAACHARFCLKRRYWTVPGLDADPLAEKSEIPCLEPCAILLELARKSARIEQEEKVPIQLSRSELESFLTGVESAIERPEPGDRSGNISAASNPRRLQLLMEKFKRYLSSTHEEQDEI